MALTDVSFDLTQNAPKAASTGYTRAIREGLKEEAYVKFREVFVKKVIKTPLSLNLQVSSYKASEMDNKENFFHAISGFTHASTCSSFKKSLSRMLLRIRLLMV